MTRRGTPSRPRSVFEQLMRLRRRGVRLSQRWTPRSDPLLMRAELLRHQSHLLFVRGRRYLDRAIAELPRCQEVYQRTGDPDDGRQVALLYIVRWIRCHYLEDLRAPEARVGFAMLGLVGDNTRMCQTIREREPEVYRTAVRELREIREHPERLY